MEPPIKDAFNTSQGGIFHTLSWCGVGALA